MPADYVSAPMICTETSACPVLEELLETVYQVKMHRKGAVPIPGEAAHCSGVMPPTNSEMISPTVPR
jgi:hypothetical protein